MNRSFMGLGFLLLEACAMREVSPGHYVMGLDTSGEQAPAEQPAQAAGEAPAAAAPAPAAAAPGPATQGAQQASATAAATPPAGPHYSSLIRDHDLARQKQVDLGVFGISLGEPVSVQACADAPFNLAESMQADPPGPPGTATCQPTGADVPYQVRIWTQGTTRLPDLEPVMLQVPNSKCPDWLRAGGQRCRILAEVDGPYLAALYFPVGGESWESAIEQALTKKYGTPTKDAQSACKNRSLGVVTQKLFVRSWTLPGLVVRYDPLFTCASQDSAGTGRLVIQLASVREMYQDLAKAQEENAPKM